MGKGKGKGKKSALREDEKLEAAWRELASWRFARGLKRVSRSTLLKSKRWPGANARKANWEAKQMAKRIVDLLSRLDAAVPGSSLCQEKGQG